MCNFFGTPCFCSWKNMLWYTISYQDSWYIWQYMNTLTIFFQIKNKTHVGSTCHHPIDPNGGLGWILRKNLPYNFQGSSLGRCRNCRRAPTEDGHHAFPGGFYDEAKTAIIARKTCFLLVVPPVC